MPETDAKIFIRELSKSLGFDDIGFTAAVNLDKEYKLYTDWLDAGYHAGMQYLARREGKRKDVNMLLDNAATVIVVLQNYNTNFRHSNKKHYGKISRYAWGDDYHDVMKKKLIELTKKVDENYPGHKFKVYVDTGPVLEKQWAVRAGLGWQGKNSLLLNKRLGSYVFTGIIITDMKIQPDTPVKDMCGKCTACIDACPTQAIVQPKVVDSRKCLSYWTIETKGDKEFPSDIAENLEGWLFGCDICQEVCPWNRKDVFTSDEAYMPRDNQTEILLDDIMQMNEDEFRHRFKNSPVKRSKLKGLQRNALALIKSKNFLLKS